MAVFQKLRDELDAILSLGTRRDAAKVAIDAIGGLMAPAWHQLQAVRALQWVAVAARNEKVGGQARGAIDSVHAVLRDFLAGWFDTIAVMRQDKAKTVEIAKEVMGTDEPTTIAIYDGMMPMFNDDGHFKPKATAVLSRSFVDMKTLDKEPDMTALINESFLPKK